MENNNSPNEKKTENLRGKPRIDAQNTFEVEKVPERSTEIPKKNMLVKVQVFQQYYYEETKSCQ